MRKAVFIMFCSLILPLYLFAGDVANKAIGGQEFNGSAMINATPEKVWSIISTSKTGIPLMDCEYQSGATVLTKVGDAVMVKVWGENAVVLVSGYQKNQELKITLDPENGSYVCQLIWRLESHGEGTMVSLTERYTESGPQTAENLSAQTKAWQQKLNEFKALAE